MQTNSRNNRDMSLETLLLAREIRTRSLRMVASAGASHIGSALSIADILAVLYRQVLSFIPENPQWGQRDRFILSKGHACVANYAALAAIGCIDEEAASSYGADFSPLMNHISHKVPGVEFSTGSLGHGLPFGVGKALAAKKLDEQWQVFVLVGDGEMQEGSNWEAIMFAAHQGLNNVTLIVDYNNLQSLTTVDNTLSIEPLSEKISSFGWDVFRIDGHSHEALEHHLNVKTESPKCIICDTVKGKGVSFMENQVAWHYSAPNKEELESALSEVASEK
jgi:transketolase